MYHVAFVCLSIATLTLAIATPTTTVAQSFDCGKAGTKVEKMICDTPAIGALDSEMGRTYKAARASLSEDDKIRFRDAQRAWLKERNRCTEPECVYAAYVDRLATITTTTDAFPGWAGVYENAEGLEITITATGDGTYKVGLFGAGANWTCGDDTAGRGTPRSKTRLVTQSEDRSSLMLDALGTGIVLPDNAQNQKGQTILCGIRAPSITGFYRRVK